MLLTMITRAGRFMALARYEEALEAFEQAIRQDLYNPDFYGAKAYTLWKLKRPS